MTDDQLVANVSQIWQRQIAPAAANRPNRARTDPVRRFNPSQTMLAINFLVSLLKKQWQNIKVHRDLARPPQRVSLILT